MSTKVLVLVSRPEVQGLDLETRRERQGVGLGLDTEKKVLTTTLPHN